MSEWLDIASAPKDGTWLWLYCPGIENDRDYEAESAPPMTMGRFAARDMAEPAWVSTETQTEFWDYGGATGAGCCIELREICPTHWMPLPPPPVT